MYYLIYLPTIIDNLIKQYIFNMYLFIIEIFYLILSNFRIDSFKSIVDDPD